MPTSAGVSTKTSQFVGRAKALGVSFWIDTAERELIKQATSLGAMGATTNPALTAAEVKKGTYTNIIQQFLSQLQQAGKIDAQTSPWDRVHLVEFELRKHMALERVSLVEQDLSVEVNPFIDEMRLRTVQERADFIYNEGKTLSQLDPKVVIKIGFSEWGLLAAERLQEEGIRVNMTLAFSEEAALLSALAGVYVVSMFLGRFADWAGKSGLGDIDTVTQRGTHAVHNTIELFQALGLAKTKFVPASLRSADHLVNTIYPERTIPTIPPKVFLEGIETLPEGAALLKEEDVLARHNQWVQQARTQTILGDFRKAFPDGLPSLEEAIAFYKGKGRGSPFVDPFADQGVRLFADQQAALERVIFEAIR